MIQQLISFLKKRKRAGKVWKKSRLCVFECVFKKKNNVCTLFTQIGEVKLQVDGHSNQPCNNFLLPPGHLNHLAFDLNSIRLNRLKIGKITQIENSVPKYGNKY